MLGSGFFTAVMGETLATFVGPVRPVGRGEPDEVRTGDSYTHNTNKKQESGKCKSNSEDLDFSIHKSLNRNLKCNLNQQKDSVAFVKF